jgi:hypothetical protein
MDVPEPGGEAEYGLVMPFLPVASKGGPYDDDAFVAGYEMGRLDAELKASPGLRRVETMVHSPNAGQADLLAMQHGYTCTAEVCEEYPEWTRVVFDPARERV